VSRDTARCESKATSRGTDRFSVLLLNNVKHARERKRASRNARSVENGGRDAWRKVVAAADIYLSLIRPLFAVHKWIGPTQPRSCKPRCVWFNPRDRRQFHGSRQRDRHRTIGTITQHPRSNARTGRAKSTENVGSPQLSRQGCPVVMRRRRYRESARKGARFENTKCRTEETERERRRRSYVTEEG